VDDEERVTLIDFPQMVSTRHANAAELFDRDAECIGRFFRKKLGYMPELDADLPCVRPDFQARAGPAALPATCGHREALELGTGPAMLLGCSRPEGTGVRDDAFVWQHTALKLGRACRPRRGAGS